MLQRRAVLRVPFVVTTAVVTIGACAPTTPPPTSKTEVPAPGPQHPNDVSTPPPPRAEGPANSPRSVECPAEPPARFSNCKEQLGDQTCEYRLSCHSGQHAVSFKCDPDEARVVEPTPCSYEMDECDAGVQCMGGKWYRHEGTNPPPPCPKQRPAVGASCESRGFEREGPCGYFCDDGTTWTVASCSAAGKWKFDGRCSP